MDDIKINGYYRDPLIKTTVIKARYTHVIAVNQCLYRVVRCDVYHQFHGFCAKDFKEKDFFKFFKPMKTKEAKKLLKAWGYGK